MLNANHEEVRKQVWVMRTRTEGTLNPQAEFGMGREKTGRAEGGVSVLKTDLLLHQCALMHFQNSIRLFTSGQGERIPDAQVRT